MQVYKSRVTDAHFEIDNNRKRFLTSLATRSIVSLPILSYIPAEWVAIILKKLHTPFEVTELVRKKIEGFYDN